MRMRHCILTAVAIGLVLTSGVPRVASAMVFFSAAPATSAVSFGVSKARNGGRGPDTIILEAGTARRDSDPERFAVHGLLQLIGSHRRSSRATRESDSER